MARLCRAGVFLLLLAASGGSTFAQARGESETLVFSGVLRATLTDNLFLLGSDEAPGEVISGATLALSYSRVRQRSSFSVMSWLNGSVYHRYSAYNGLAFGLGMGGQTGLDSRARMRYGLSFSDGLNLEALYASRVGLPNIDVKSFSASTGLAYNITPDTVGTLSFDGSALRYRTELRTATTQLPGDLLAPPDVLVPLNPGDDNPDTGAPPVNNGSVQVLSDLAAEGIRVFALDYWSWRAGAGLAHTFSQETRVNVDFDYRRSYSDSGSGLIPDGELMSASAGLTQAIDPTANLTLGYTFQDSRYGFGNHTHTMVSRMSKVFGKKVRGDLSLGASYFDGSTVQSSAWDLIGGAGLSVQLKQTSIVMRYGHVRYQGVITGHSQITDDGYLSLGHTFGKKVFGSIYGLYRNAHNEFVDLYASDEILGGAAISVKIDKRWNLSTSYAYSHYGRGAFPAASRNFLSFALAYSRAMKP